MTGDGGFVRIVDIVILVTVLECAGLIAWRLVLRRGLAVPDIVFNLLAGLCLMLALRCLAGGAEPGWAAMWLLLSGVAHVSDLRRRWQASPPPAALLPRR